MGLIDILRFRNRRDIRRRQRKERLIDKFVEKANQSSEQNLDKESFDGARNVDSINLIDDEKVIVADSNPMKMSCPYCRYPIVTYTNRYPNKCGWRVFGCLAISTCFLCACCVECCNTLFITNHICPKCQVVITQYSKRW